MKLRHAAKALIRRRSDNKYLMLWASEWKENPRRSRMPDLPGGMVEEGESMTQGLLREIREEVGLDVAESELLLAHAHMWNSEDVSTIFEIYFAETVETNVTLSWEHEHYEWLSADELTALEIRSPYPEIIDHLVKVGILT